MNGDFASHANDNNSWKNGRQLLRQYVFRLCIQHLKSHSFETVFVSHSGVNFSVLAFKYHLVVYVSKGMLAVKLYCNKILTFLTGGAGERRLSCIMAVKCWW